MLASTQALMNTHAGSDRLEEEGGGQGGVHGTHE
jgi:hypothetical protein